MAWTDLLAGIGGGAIGVGRAVNEQADRKSREKVASDNAESRERIAALQGEIKAMVEDKKTSRAMSVEELKQKGRMSLRELINSGNIDETRLKTDTAKYLGELHAANVIDAEELKGMIRLTEKERDVEIQAAHDKSRETVGAGHDTASTSNAATRAQSATDVANINQGGANERFNKKFPLDVFRAEQGRYPRGSAAASAARRMPGGITAPRFGPSYEDFMKSAPPGVAPPAAAPPAPSGAGPGLKPQAFGAMPQPSPLLRPDALGIPDYLQPGKNPFSIGGQPSAPPPEATPPPPSWQQPGARGFQGAAAPTGIEQPGMVPSQPSLSLQPTVPGAKSQLTTDQNESQGRALMVKIKEMNQQGNFAEARRLTEQLSELVKQQRQ